MKHLDRINDEELRLLDSINKMSRQVTYTYQQSHTTAHSQMLVEIIESMKDQYQSLRKKRGAEVSASFSS
ncbi:MAG: hypothetical protein H8E21_10225 [Gammaproteobacteria bacterium]|nr:hypothetical protein [Gammaproteobacteria bacterium]